MRPDRDRGHASRPHASRGAALLMALTAIVIVTILASALGTLVVAGIRSARTASRDDALLNAAESGVDIAISRLARDPSWRGGGSVTVPGGTCAISVRPAGEGVFQVTSRAGVTSRAAPAARLSSPKSAGGRKGTLHRRSCTVRVRIEAGGSGTPGFAVIDWDAAFRQ